MSDIVDLGEERKRRAFTNGDDVAPSDVLEAAKSANLLDVIIIGRMPDGTLYFGGSRNVVHAADMNWQVDVFKQWLFNEMLD